jgi:DNA-binding CsgD family transcriptional regulator
MEYNYGTACRKFRTKWDKLGREYADAGMSPRAIREMCEFDWQELKSERVFLLHNQLLECFFPDDIVVSEDNSPLIHRQLGYLSVNQPEICEWGRYDWVEDIDTPALARRIKALSQADLELLTYLVVDGMTRTEIADGLNITRSAVTQRLTRIKKRLEKARRT